MTEQERQEGHRCEDGEVLCAEHAPSYADFLRQLEDQLKDDPGDAALIREIGALRDREASGAAMDEKIVYPL